MKQQPQKEKWEAVGGSNELNNGRQGWPIRTSSLSTTPHPPHQVRHLGQLFTSVCEGLRDVALSYI